MRAKLNNRFLARVADIIICLVAIFLVLVLTNTSPIIKIIVEGSAMEVDAFFLINMAIAGVIATVFLIFYDVIAPHFFSGHTLGMYLFHVRIENEDGTKPDFFSIFIRQFLAQDFLAIVTLGLTELLTLLLVLFRRDRHSIADIFSKTKIVDDKGE